MAHLVLMRSRLAYRQFAPPTARCAAPEGFMDLASFNALLTPAGQEVLAAALALVPQEADFLRCFGALSRSFPPNLARAALETAILRREARPKFPAASQMYFTRPALEQATSQAIAAYRAERYAGLEQIIDLGCSIGGDTLALCAQAPTLGLDLDPLRLALAAANAAGLGLDSQAAFAQADLTAPLPLRLSPRGGLFFDPARRAEGRRAFSVHQYRPPLAVIQGWLGQPSALGVKISPGVDLAELAEYPAEVEFISLHGELKEAVLWFGPLRRGAARYRATLIDDRPQAGDDPTAGEPIRVHTLEGGEGDRDAARVSTPQAYLYEPDPAVLRAGVVRRLGQQLDADQLDPDIAYLTSDRAIDTPFARRWRVESWQPFQLKRLRAALRAAGVGRVTVKKRGSPIQPEQLIHDLRLSGGPEERVLFLTQCQGQPVVVIAFSPSAASFP